MIFAYLTHKFFGWKWAFVRIHDKDTKKKEGQLTRFMVTLKPNGKRQIWVYLKTLGPWGEWVQFDNWNDMTLVYPSQHDLVRVKPTKTSKPQSK